jgi:hypothetical protein
MQRPNLLNTERGTKRHPKRNCFIHEPFRILQFLNSHVPTIIVDDDPFSLFGKGNPFWAINILSHYVNDF